jgi:hypothetical protein
LHLAFCGLFFYVKHPCRRNPGDGEGLWAEISSGIQIFLICIFMKYVNITVVIRIAARSELELASSFVEFAAM